MEEESSRREVKQFTSRRRARNFHGAALDSLRGRCIVDPRLRPDPRTFRTFLRNRTSCLPSSRRFRPTGG
ncbi:hypothetical protein PSMK_19020 [Phycisphaera mikurensis NBRC 102666]|uniref:Uncharacterized protein n=1 Tax=Phycisphaera mikurensis (strain NBRC 102666 / KCTC 22515 / FYK2301M01) TaxID=1142394 RepID=I0IFM3_PHYMF|nr:hypothetical protein PSMK_19020 [Phycisphaera mikurensis NBRC 102666]